LLARVMTVVVAAVVEGGEENARRKFVDRWQSACVERG